MRQDKFKVGDRVSFVEVDPYIGYDMEERHRKQHGRGPYVVDEIEEVPEWQLSTRGLSHVHSQYLTVNGERYSGAWFNPMREPALT